MGVEVNSTDVAIKPPSAPSERDALPKLWSAVVVNVEVTRRSAEPPAAAKGHDLEASKEAIPTAIDPRCFPLGADPKLANCGRLAVGKPKLIGHGGGGAFQGVADEAPGPSNTPDSMPAFVTAPDDPWDERGPRTDRHTQQSRPTMPVMKDDEPKVDEGQPQDDARKTTTSWMSTEPQYPPTADMSGDRTGLGKIAGRFYPIGSVRQFLHPSCLGVVFVTCLGYSANVFVPDIDAFWAGLSWNLAYLAIQGTTGAFLLVVCGGPRWAFFPFLVLILALMNVSFHFAGTSLFGATLAYISFAAFTCKWQKRPSILSGILAWMFAFQISLLLVLLFIEPIQSKCGGNEMCRGLVLPVCSWIYSTVGLILMKRTVQSCAPVGTPLVSISAFIALLVASSEGLKLASLVQSAMEDTDEGGIKMLATAALTSFVGDFAKRVLLPQRFQHLVLQMLGIKYQFTVSPEMDVVLRAMYTVSYYPAIPALLFSFVGLAAGAPWASKWIYWVAMACFVLTDLIADFLLVTIHRRFYPVLDETPRQTWTSLTDPRQHWPTMQMGQYNRSKHSRRQMPNLQEEDLQESWSHHSWLNDTMICCLCFSALTTMTTKFAMASVLSRCRLDVAAHLCSAFEGA